MGQPPVPPLYAIPDDDHAVDFLQEQDLIKDYSRRSSVPARSSVGVVALLGDWLYCLLAKDVFLVILES